MGGYETCKHLKDNKDTANIDVIFVSANEPIDEKLKGYDAGGSDSLNKPVQPLELISKVWTAVASVDDAFHNGGFFIHLLLIHSRFGAFASYDVSAQTTPSAN